MSKILLAVTSGHYAANLLRGEVFRRLLDSPYRLVIASPLADDPRFVDEFRDPRVMVEPLPRYRLTPREQLRTGLSYLWALQNRPTETRRIKWQQTLARSRPPLRMLLTGLHRLVAAIPPGVAAPLELHRPIRRARRIYRPLFARHAPALVVTPTPGIQYIDDLPLILEAERNRVPTMAVDVGWDNLTAKFAQARPVGSLLVWSPVLKAQAEVIHDIPADRTAAVGVPHFDLYFTERHRLLPRETFLRKLGLRPDRPLITVTTTPKPLYGFHRELIALLLRGIREGRIGGRPQVLVRLHPRDHLADYDGLGGESDVVLERPFRPTPVDCDGLMVDPSAEDRLHLANTLAHSDVVINVASTITLEACIFDRPVVNIAFDGDRQLPYLESAARVYDYTHYRPVVAAGGVHLARTVAEMFEGINAYLRDPARHRAERARIVREQVAFTDGRASARVAEAILAAARQMAAARPGTGGS